MCGGVLEINNNESVAQCEYCGTQQTIPTTTDDIITNLYNRANNLRLKCEFDKAAQIYEKIVENNEGEAEAHWGIVLCKYGIEYVEEPHTLKHVPTCHRTSFDSIMKDLDYLAAIDYADTSQQSIYENEARVIDKIQKDILSIVNNEKPFDVFICYKETDEYGKRTIDSSIANDIYYQLTQEGFKVFYAAITLEDKLGQEYEPYIFSALNSAKVMLVIGTKPEYFNAIWVKNEWSRFINFMKTERSKLLIPCYRDMDAYDLPEEFAHLQGQDMGKIGFINDVVRGIKKVINADILVETEKEATISSNVNANIGPLLERAFICLEDREWSRADEFCEQVLNHEPKNAQAYLVKLMADLHITKKEDLKDCAEPFDKNNNYQKAVRFGDENLVKVLDGYIEYIKVRNENQRLEGIYNEAHNLMTLATTEDEYKKSAELFATIPQYKDASDLAFQCNKKAEEAKQEFEEEKKECNLLLAELRKLHTRKNEYARKKKEIAEERVDIIIHMNKLNDLISNWDVIERDMKQNHYDIAMKNQKVAELCDEKSRLSIFSLKRKKEIEQRMYFLNQEVGELRKREKNLAEKFLGYHSLEQVCSKYDEKVKQKAVLEEMLSNDDTQNALEILRNKMQSYQYGKKCLELFDVISNARIGDTISFGQWLVKKDFEKGEIDWIVLAKDFDKVTLISKEAIEYQPYNETRDRVTWEECTLRQWLNNDFYETAFSDMEKLLIQMSNVSADKNPEYSSDSGAPTQDKVFLPSIDEVNKYFKSNIERQCKVTEFLNHHDTPCLDEAGNCIWVLRTPGYDNSYVSVVFCDGTVRGDTHFVNSYGYYATRPMLCLGLEG